MENQKIFEVVKRRKLEPAAKPDASEAAKDVSMQSTTHELVNNSESECQSSCYGSEVTPQEFAFSIDDVLEQILSSLDGTSLVTCRLVSHRWRLSSTNVILERGDAETTFKYSPANRVYVKQTTAAVAGAAHNLTLVDLTRVLEENYGPRGRGPFKMSDFPCQKFDFEDGSLSDPHLQSFLTTFGEYITVLFLDFSDSSEGEGEATLLKRIRRLLNTQAPHLRILCFGSSSSKLGLPETDDSHHPAVSCTPSGPTPQFQNYKEQEANENNRKERIGLVALDYRGGQRTIFDYIISISPNLRKIIIDCHNYHFLSAPLNRLHLLEEFEYDIGEDEMFDFENFKLIEAALCVSIEERESQKLPPIKFKELSIDFDNIVDPMMENPDVQSSFVRVIGKILELSWDTLECISLVNLMQDTLNGLKWPRVLSNVRELKFCLENVNGSGLEVLPWNGNFKIQETFPKLKMLTFDEVIDYDGEVPISSPGEFLRNCDFGPAPNVEFVEATVYVFLDDDDVRADVDVAEDVQRFRSDVTYSLVRLFPSAELIIKDKVFK